jgi:hypothetical protein
MKDPFVRASVVVKDESQGNLSRKQDTSVFEGTMCLVHRPGPPQEGRRGTKDTDVDC